MLDNFYDSKNMPKNLMFWEFFYPTGVFNFGSLQWKIALISTALELNG